MKYSALSEINFPNDEAILMTIIVAFLLNAAIGLIRESMTVDRLDEVAKSVRELNAKLEEVDDESEEDLFEPPTFRFFKSGEFAHYFEDPDENFILILPDDILRGTEIIQANMGRVTRSNPNGNPVIAYIDSEGLYKTYFLPEYSGRSFCDFINRHI